MRTTRILMLSLAMGGAVILAACGSDSNSSSGASATTAASAGAATTAATATTADASPATTAATSATTSAASATTAAPAGGGTALAVGQMNGKSVLVDNQGFALYVFTKDATPGKSVCNAGCAAAWPPVASDSATPSLGAGLDADDVTVIARDDGTKQLAFYGHPLYHFQGDTAAGQTNGEGSGGVWFLVDTEGNAVKS